MNRSQSVNIIPVTNNSAQSTSDKPSECKPKVIYLKGYGKNAFVYQIPLIRTFHIDYIIIFKKSQQKNTNSKAKSGLNVRFDNFWFTNIKHIFYRSYKLSINF